MTATYITVPGAGIFESVCKSYIVYYYVIVQWPSGLTGLASNHRLSPVCGYNPRK